MILLQFLSWVLFLSLALTMFLRFFGRPLMRWFLKFVLRRAQKDLERQSRVYDEFVEGHSPYADSVMVDDQTRVTIKKESAKRTQRKSSLDDGLIEEVEFEDL